MKALSKLFGIAALACIAAVASLCPKKPDLLGLRGPEAVHVAAKMG